MTRLARLAVPGYPHHVLQRGNNRQPIFVDADDRRRMLAELREQAQAHGVAVHAYVLMGNHLHLLVTPDAADSLPLMMQGVGRAYVRWFNRRHARSGTLWEGRYRSALIEAERYLLACMAYIDLNPVRAGMVAAPADYPWSSHAHLVGLRHDPLVTPHALYWQLGNTPFARERAYADLVAAGLSPTARDALGGAAHSGWALGGDAFIAELQKQTERRVTRGAAGRPVSRSVEEKSG
ncbi:transposase [Ottowia sp.]|uniref:REP-associated tyrosine transposase n=1 Tax=Ottowia sp. TaxID=1898956 RepID=UPI002B9E5FB3|nr:transposase [Ottowia sp.]HOB67648.1 transposase [Ottowia sp.]HPZ58273.1 transposase [Ottowia sp.]HQD48328.1 transposase [Ottowia sp.]